MILKVIKQGQQKANPAQGGRSATRATLDYLYGPGRAQEHHNPRMVASWDDLAADPAAAASPETFAVQLAELANELARLSLIHTGHGERLWHCAVRTAPTDRLLTDEEWNQTAREMVHAAGVAPKGDPDACRWIAVRHADDHIHIVATLRRLDGKAPRLGNDYLRLRQACRSLENRYGLTVTPPVDWTASHRPTRSEIGKAQRLSRRQRFGQAHAAASEHGQHAVAGALKTGRLKRRLPVGATTHTRRDTNMGFVTAQWALERRPQGQTGQVFSTGSSQPLLDQLRDRAPHTGGAPPPDADTTERYPRVSFGPLTLSGDRYLAATLEDRAQPTTPTQKPETQRLMYALPLSAPSSSWSYRGIYDRLLRSGVPIPEPAEGASNPGFIMNPAPYDADQLAAMVNYLGLERVTTTAAKLLEGEVHINDAVHESQMVRPEFLDAVAALLPYQLRLQLTASIGVSDGDHQMRLAIAATTQPNADPLDPDTPTMPAQARQATEYLRLLRSAAHSREQLARTIQALDADQSPYTFGEPERIVQSLRDALAQPPSQRATESRVNSTSEEAPTEQASQTMTARETLERRVRHVAAGADGEQAFFQGLATAGVRARTHDVTDPDGRRVPTGYEVHLPGDVNQTGEPIWYAGSTLAPDLSLPRVRERWEGVFRPPDSDPSPTSAQAPPPSDARARTWKKSADRLDEAAESFTSDDDIGDRADTGRAATSQAIGDLLTVAADQAPSQVREQLTEAADAFERGARVPIQRAHNEVSSGLRLATQAMHAAGQAMNRGQETAALTAVIVAAAGALQAALAWQRARHLTAQTESTQRAITHLRLAAWQLDPAHHAPDQDAARRPDFRQAVQATLAGVADPARIIGDPAYPTLATVLSRAEHANLDPAQVLRDAAIDAGLGSGQVTHAPLADALAFHAQQRLNSHSQADADNHQPNVKDAPTANQRQDTARSWDRYAALVQRAAQQWFGDHQADLRSPELLAALRASENAGLEPEALLRDLRVPQPERDHDGALAPDANSVISRALADQITRRLTDQLRDRSHPDWAQLRPALVEGLHDFGLDDTVDTLYSPVLEEHLHRAQADGIDISALVRATASAVGPVASAGVLQGALQRRVGEALFRPDTPFVSVLREYLAQGPGIPTPEHVAADPAWKTVIAKLRAAAAAGHHPGDVLKRAVTSGRGLKGAESVAKVIAWRIDKITGGRSPGRPGEGPRPADSRSVPRRPPDRVRTP